MYLNCDKNFVANYFKVKSLSCGSASCLGQSIACELNSFVVHKILISHMHNLVTCNSASSSPPSYHLIIAK